MREGAYDGRYHFLDGETGEAVRPPLVTGDLAKGSATSDPDGFPLYYAGSRDGHLRVVALDRDGAGDALEHRRWHVGPRPLRNDDWDGAALVVGDYLLEGSENGWFYVIRLHRATTAAGSSPCIQRWWPRSPASTKSCSRSWATRRCRSRTRSLSEGESRTSRTPVDSCRDGTFEGCSAAATRCAGCSGSGSATTSMPRS